MPVSPSHRSQSMELIGFYMRATLAFSGLNEFLVLYIICVCICIFAYRWMDEWMDGWMGQ